MIVVHRLVGLAGVVDDAVLERDAAVGEAVGELEIVERRQVRRRFDLRAPPLSGATAVLQLGGDEADGASPAGI